MAREGLEVADVFRRFGPAFREQHGASLSSAQRHAMTAVESCRTAALGGHVEQCGDCGHQRVSYNSCRDRNCHKCQGLARAQWLEHRQAELLEVPYFHVVFTVPAEIEAIAFQNQTVVYDILFRAASETLRTIAPPTRSIWVRRLASSVCCTAGGSPSRTTRTCIFSYLVAGSRQTVKVGSRAGPGLSYPSRYCHACSEGCSCTPWRRRSSRAS